MKPKPKPKTKTKPQRQAARLKPVPKKDQPTWEYIVFGDLHVKASTLARCVMVLRRIRQEAKARGCPVICTGDFWDQRGHLSVRQHDEIANELDEFEREEVEIILIPGNHDQVSRDGRIHGLRVFSKYKNIRVVNDPEQDTSRKIAFIPWREDPEEQERMFRDVPAGYVVFGHGEVKGAVANNGHKSAGKFVGKAVEHLRAVYLGHYHKRQQIANVFYIGSPYEQNMGERNMPHGFAVVRSSRFEPEHINLDDFPKHWRLNWPNDASIFSAPREQDIVEVLAPKQELRSPAFLEALATIHAKDVRPLPLASVHTKGAPTFALNLPEAIIRFVDEFDSLGKDLVPERLKARGQEILAGVADKGAIVPLGNTVHIDEVHVEGFCAVLTKQVLPLKDLGTCLLRGPMGSGKTALADAATWCFYGTISPRKPGAGANTIKADKVIHDLASEARVATYFRIDDSPIRYCVERVKRRGKGATIAVTADGEDFMSAGISDSQDLIHHLVGIDYELWRTCVSLGQGEVQNFVTDAQKRRTELLERAFQLGPCPHAVKATRDRLKKLRAAMEQPRHRLIELNAQIQQLQSINYARESSEWDRDHQSAINGQQAIINAAQVDIAEHDKHLVHEASWNDRHEKLRGRAERLRTSLTRADPQPKLGHLHAQLGAAKAELGAARKRRDEVGRRYEAMTKAKVCSECGQTLPQDQVEQHLQDLETAIRTADIEIQTKEVQASNLQQELGKLSMEGSPDLSTIKSQLEEIDGNIHAAAQALNALAQIRVKRDHAAAAWEAANQTIQKLQAQTNPWEAKKREQERKLSDLRNNAATIRTALQAQESEEAELVFWEAGFGPKGLPVLVLRTALYELEMYANQFLSRIMRGRIYTELSMLGDDLEITFFEYDDDGEVRERDFLSLSGGQRRCVQLAFVPFALSEMIFNRTGVRVPILWIDELTAHLDPETKPLVCEILRELDRETVVVIDHDPQVQGEFDVIYDVSRGGKIRRAA